MLGGKLGDSDPGLLLKPVLPSVVAKVEGPGKDGSSGCEE